MNIRLIFGLSVLVLLATNQLILAYHAIPDANQNSFTQTSGTIQTIACLVIGYYFGSSDGSRRKTDMLASQSEQATGKPNDPINVKAEEISS